MVDGFNDWNPSHLALLKATVSVALKSTFDMLVTRLVQGAKEISQASHASIFMVDQTYGTLQEVFTSAGTEVS